MEAKELRILRATELVVQGAEAEPRISVKKDV